MLRSRQVPLAYHLLLLMLAAIVPAACFAATLALGARGLVLGASGLAFAVGIGGALLLGRALMRAIDDLTNAAVAVGREMPPEIRSIAVRELASLDLALSSAHRHVAQAQERRAAANAMVRQAETALDLAQRIGAVRAWEWDTETGAMNWLPAFYLLFRFAPGSLAPTRASFIERVHPQDRPVAAQWLARLARDGSASAIALRILRGDGEARLVFCAATTRRDEAAGRARIIGTMEDITDEAALPQPVPLPEPAPAPAAVAQHAGRVEVADLIHVAATRLERQARAAGLRLSLSLGRELGAVHGDAGQLEEILFRLSENALFLTPRGGTIAWSVAVEPNGDLRIEMGGAGLGINAAGAEGIHLAGRMVEIGYAATTARNLHTVRQLVEANGGRFEVRSNQGGSAAILTFPDVRLIPLAA